MKIGLIFTALGLTGALALACSTTVTTTHVAADPNAPDAAADGAGPDQTPADEPPHSLGTIVLGESHASGGASQSAPIVSATFVPDAKLVPHCTTALESGCEIQKAPKCTKNSTSVTGCDTNEACTFDTSCSPTCKAFAVCETACAADELCKPSGTGTSTTGTCVKAETFDAGPLAFSGTTTSITLFPPYAFKGDGNGAPFLGGADIHVQAQGATGAGFDKFDEMFTATTFIQTTPALSKLTRAQVFGTGVLPIAWAPGTDTVIVTVSGAGGSATCKVQDSLGKFDLPRSAITAALGDGTNGSALSLSVGRQKKDVRKDKTAKGTLSTATVQPVGWLELVTVSTESTSFQGCPGQQSVCGDACVDLQTDPANCKTCGNACSGGASCNAGTCGGSQAACDACQSKAQSGTCAAPITACTSDTACSALLTCLGKCAAGDNACETLCRTQNAAGTAKFDAASNCIATACSAACQ